MQVASEVAIESRESEKEHASWIQNFSAVEMLTTSGILQCGRVNFHSAQCAGTHRSPGYLATRAVWTGQL